MNSFDVDELTAPPVVKPASDAARPLTGPTHAGPAEPYEVPESPTTGNTSNGDAPLLAQGKDPYYTTKHERYTHRIMLELAAKGYTVKEIAEMTGFTSVCVNNILRQKHVQQTLVNEIRRHHGVDDEVVEIVKRNVVKVAKLYEEILNDTSIDRHDRMEVGERFWNRRYGKPTQPIAHGSVVDLNELSDEELAAMLPKPQTAKTATS